MDYETYLNESEKYYFSIRSLSCPALSGAVIYFNRKGFRHLLRKKKGFRSIHEQIRRFELLILYAKEVVLSEKSLIKHTPGVNFSFYEITKEVKEEYFVKVVVIKNGRGELNFFSIMDYDKQK